jgi:23S rRNA pseudouridine1911/1915/1917 synthase
MPKQFIISSERTGQRLDKFLVSKYPKFSRSFCQKSIQRGDVLVNNKKSKPNYILRVSDKVFWEFRQAAGLDIRPDFDIKLDIVYQNRDFLVVNKPAGIIVHPTSHQRTNTLVNALLAFDSGISAVGEDPLRPGIVHRLDKDVSGLMVVARNQRYFELLKKQFQEHKILKEYSVLVHGVPKDPSGLIDFPMARSRRAPFKMVVLRELAHPRQKLTKIKEALSEYKTIKSFKDFTLLQIKTRTGRTHQIRAHLYAIGCSIVGEKVYRFKRLKPILSRLFLHASRLGFRDLEGKWREFASEPPKELKDFLNNLK